MNRVTITEGMRPIIGRKLAPILFRYIIVRATFSFNYSNDFCPNDLRKMLVNV